jgi:predicted protein tyrosine phosphatase
MICCVDFVSLDVFQALTPAQDMLAISIGDQDDAAPANMSGFPAALRLEFLDCDEVDVADYGMPVEVLFSTVQLAQLISFVGTYHADPQRYRLVVHCRLGSSRSAAVALVAHHLTLCDFPRHPDAHHANGHVLRLASNAVGTVTAPRKVAGPEPHPYLPSQLQI